jgi:hypothetical protein
VLGTLGCAAPHPGWPASKQACLRSFAGYQCCKDIDPLSLNSQSKDALDTPPCARLVWSHASLFMSRSLLPRCFSNLTCAPLWLQATEVERDRPLMHMGIDRSSRSDLEALLLSGQRNVITRVIDREMTEADFLAV